MKNIAITIFIVLVIAVLAFYFVSFQVRETESALVMRFGKPTRELTTPKLYFKWPAPIERVEKFDSRMRVFEADLGETTTKEAMPIIVNTYIIWKIAEPLKFFNAVGTIKEAESKLRNQLSDTQNKVVGQHNFSDFVNSDPEKIKFEQIQQEMLADLGPAVRGNYGIEIRAMGIKQLKISEDVSKDVFERMKAERSRKTEAIIAQGKAEATKIQSDADLKKTQLLVTAEARAKAIQGQGDAEAAQYYKLLEEDPEFAIFLRDIDALKKILQERSTIVLSTDTEPFKLLKEIPNITPAAPSGPKK